MLTNLVIESEYCFRSLAVPVLPNVKESNCGVDSLAESSVICLILPSREVEATVSNLSVIHGLLMSDFHR